jgi:hypothetical protein
VQGVQVELSDDWPAVGGRTRGAARGSEAVPQSSNDTVLATLMLSIIASRRR